MQTYAEMTWDDPNALKRWVQRRRLRDALAQVPDKVSVDKIVDYGAGDGALAVLARERWPKARIVCFEPAPHLATEAERRVRDLDGVEVTRTEAGLPEAVDLVFCTEVFEHLPEAETGAAIARIEAILKPGGLLVVGVPVESGPVAALKGLFRMARRPKDFDTRPGNILRAVLGQRVRDRPMADIAYGRRYHPHHLGFDLGGLKRLLEARFSPVRLRGSPLPLAPVFLNSEAYMTLRKEP
ncbi:class I SAM-dependent methyltransferase [Brevundimonas sp.]|uniref:class I SAM-dependent methyltransferase n=1 Tax=Brevundimonas sp. TaxID=1871086 RepID=UPI0025D9F98C|nr:class I SAM-dependent methyltransferase [Brevundimonas sp.]